MMIRAGALYFAIVMALVISVISASLILLAAHYRDSYLKQLRYARLASNLKSAIILVLADARDETEERKFDLFNGQNDSLIIARRHWGVFEFAAIQSFCGADTLKEAFLIGNAIDSTVLYLSDEDRPLSISGDTKITGNASLPKSGVRKAYMEGNPYFNKEMIYHGKMSFSKRTLTNIDTILLKKLSRPLQGNNEGILLFPSLSNSFFDTVKYIHLKSATTLNDVDLKGNIIMFSDSALTVGTTAKLSGVQIYAPYIKIEAGFSGDCQLFASDSIVIGKGAELKYPSAIGVIRIPASGSQPMISIGEGTRITGIVFSYEPKRSTLQTMIGLAKNVTVNGEIYCVGLLKLEKSVKVNGKVSCNQFIMRTKTSQYENFLADIEFNRLALSKYYLGPELFNYPGKKQVMSWLN
jgi:hypothetical protein